MNESFSDNLNLNSDPINTGDDPNEQASTAEPPKHHYKPFLMLFSILMTGTAGWKDLRRSRIKPEQAAAGCFYPLLALAAACRFASWFYLPEFDLSSTLVSAASIFASFFFSYFAVQVVCKWIFPYAAKAKTETPFFKLLVQYALSSLALFSIPAEILPMLEPVTVLLPIWTAFIITKGIRFLRLPEKYVNRCMAIIVLSVIVMPFLFMWICDLIFK